MRGLVLLSLLLVVSTTAFALNQSGELKGIKTVHAVVFDLSDDLVRDGVQEERIRTTLEAGLTAAGLNVLAQDQYDDTAPTITVRVSAIREPSRRFYAIDIVLACVDNVSNSRIVGPFSAAIWSNDVLELLGKVDLSRVVEGEKKLVDLFLKDYLEANPQ